MYKNITLRLDDALLSRIKHIAVDYNISVSAWVSATLEAVVNETDGYQSAKQSALKDLQEGFPLGGRPLTRNDIYAR